jgi:hypothetical protein
MPTYYKHNQLEAIDLPKQGKFDLTAYVVPDEDCLPDDFDCYTETQYNAWRNDEWYFVGVYVVASVNGIELAESSLWGIEYGSFPLTDENDNLESVSEITLATLTESVLPDLITETISEAEEALKGLTNA